MLSGAVDRSLSLARLEREIQAYRSEVAMNAHWFFRERYVDRAVLDPYYILEFKGQVDDPGDDLYDQQLFTTPYPGLRGVCITRETQGPGYSYWRTISKDELDGRLERFIKMYREDYLQPPGAKGDLYKPQYQHERFKEKRFLFEIHSESKGIIGVGPKMYAGVMDMGAVCGQVTDEQGEPLDDATVELILEEESLSRTTRAGGLFWFSKVPKGSYRIRVKDRTCIVQLLKREAFGNVKGWLVDQDGWPVTNAELQFKAPDGEVFNAWSNLSGKFTTGPLPAFPVRDSPLSKFPYLMNIPGFMFSVEKSVHVKDAIIGGTLRGSDGIAMAGQTVVLKQNGAQLAQTKTDNRGNFRFFGLLGGRYQIEVPGQKIYLSQVDTGRVKGKEPYGSVPETRIELVAAGNVVGIERLSKEKDFSFDDVAPGRYTIQSTEDRHSDD